MKYRTICADPPWDVKRLSSPMTSNGWYSPGRQRIGSTPLAYESMPVSAITILPVAAIAEDDAHLYLWVINAYVEAAYSIARAWGFRPTTLLTWAKLPMGIGPGGAFSQTSEHILFCTRGHLAPIRRTDSTWWTWPRRARQHSAKPEHFYDLVEQVSPGPYVELFSRRHRLGWDVHGFESANTAQWETA